MRYEVSREQVDAMAAAMEPARVKHNRAAQAHLEDVPPLVDWLAFGLSQSPALQDLLRATAEAAWDEAREAPADAANPHRAGASVSAQAGGASR